jgi:trimeric autotransporter adhesin
MTSNNQVSPVIRISRGERDASARATHLKAASRKYLETTIERKQMSTTTNFKRIALVAVAALGLGVLSSVPSQAVGNLVVTSANGTTAAGKSDSTTAATLTLSATIEDSRDTITVSFTGNGTLGDSVTANSVAGAARLIYLDTNTAARTLVGAGTITAPTPSAKLDSLTANTSFYVTSASAGNVGAKFGIQLDSATTQVAGTYSFTVFVKQYTQGVTLPVTTSYTLSVVSTAPASASATASAATSTAVLYGAGTWAAAGGVDSTVAIAAEASSTAGASVKIDLLNAASGQTSVRDSITVSIDKGNVSIGTSTSASSPTGKSLAKYSYVGSSVYVHIYPDGSTGAAVLTIATQNAGTFTKRLSFTGDAASATATVVSSVIAASGTGAILGTSSDALKNSLLAGTSLFAYSSDTSVISNYGTACGSYDATIGGVLCNLTGVKSGTANITLRDKSTVALSTVASNAVAVRVSIGEVATSAKITFNKTSYAPGEKVTAIVTVYDAAGKSMPAGDYSNVFAAGGITTSSQLTWAAGESLTAVNVKTAGNTTASATAPVVSTEPIAQFTYFLPTTGGNVVFTAKGGTGLATAGQVAITASATVVDSGAAALAAVTALATTVASLRTLIVTLTNLVLKIQKKVKA